LEIVRRFLDFVLAEKQLLSLLHRRARRVRLDQDLTNVGVNGGIIIDDKDTLVHDAIAFFFSLALGDTRCSSSVNDAPVPGPSLKALREPPISLAASAPLCRLNPCPSRFVVNP